MSPSTIHLVVNLPYNRPNNAPNDPLPVEWNQEKENILWEVIAKSRALEGSGTDWQGLSNHLQVPLPYLLYRAQVRYEQDLKGIQDIRGALGSQSSKRTTQGAQPVDKRALRSPTALRVVSSSSEPNISSSLNTPTSPRNVQPARAVVRRGSSQTLKVKGVIHDGPGVGNDLRLPSPTLSDEISSEGDDDSQNRELKKEEEQDALTKRLQELEKVITNERLGLVQRHRNPSRSASLTSERRHSSAPSSVAPENPPESLSASPQGSIPSIPSPLSGSQVINQPTIRMQSPPKSPLASPLPSRGQGQLRYFPSRTRASDKGSSTQASTASSFSDISEADVSASILESAQLSNSPGGSRLSAFAGNRFGTHR